MRRTTASALSRCGHSFDEIATHLAHCLEPHAAVEPVALGEFFVERADVRRADARSLAGTAGQSERHASVDTMFLYSIRTGIVLNRENRRTSARLGHQS